MSLFEVAVLAILYLLIYDRVVEVLVEFRALSERRGRLIRGVLSMIGMALGFVLLWIALTS